MPRSNTMRAARVAASGHVHCEAAPAPEPAAKQVRYRVEGCGVSAFAAWWCAAQGRDLSPGEPGNEAWGIVDAVGPGVDDAMIGERIASFSTRGFAEYDVADVHSVVKLEAELAGLPFPAASLARVMEAFERSRIVAGQLIAVIGVGFLGAALVQLARQAGARVIAVSRRSFSLTIAREMGAAIIVQLGPSDQTLALVTEQTMGQLCSVVIDAAGTPEALTLASELVEPGGTVVMAGCPARPCEVNVRLWHERGIDVLSPFLVTPEAKAAAALSAAQALRSGGLDLSALYTHELPLERAGEALELARSRPLGFVKAIVRP